MSQSDQFYQDIAQEAVVLHEEFGTTYSIRAAGTYDDEALSVTTGTSRTARGIVVDSQKVLGPAGEDVTTSATSTTLILEAEAAPLDNEEVLVDGVYYSLANVKPLQPANVVLIYLLELSN